jgi:hypothetical protein
MKRSLAAALTLIAVVAGSRAASAQQCNDFAKISQDIQAKAMAVKKATQEKVDRKEVCALVVKFVDAQGTAVKFLETNKTWCGVPDQAITGAKAEHEQAIKFRTVVCSNDQPQARPKVPTLSDAIGTPTLDTSKNTKTGRGTFDTLTGNPLAK